jgi:hypothetical protein
MVYKGAGGAAVQAEGKRGPKVEDGQRGGEWYSSRLTASSGRLQDKAGQLGHGEEEGARGGWAWSVCGMGGAGGEGGRGLARRDKCMIYMDWRRPESERETK